MTFAILGGGLAGWSAAATLRDRGYDGRIVIIANEREPPYDRPPLSKDYLRGERTRAETLLRPAPWYAEQEIELETGVTATHLDASNHRVVLDGGRELAYERVLVATGGRPRRLDVPGSDLAGIMYLRSIEDAERIREALLPGLRVCIVGGGFIGLEVAAAARRRGAEVTIIEALSAPLERILGHAIGDVCGELHRDQGVNIRTGCAVAGFAGTQRVSGVLAADGSLIGCDAAIVGVGIEPAVEALAGSGVKVGDGVVVDALMRTTVEGVYAAGDVARHAHPRHGSVRVEHWQNALDQGATAARNMLDAAEPYAPVHWFWSDQYDSNLQYAGFAPRWDSVVLRGDPADRSFLAFYLTDGALTAAFGMNRGRDVRRAARLIESGQRIDPRALSDEGLDLRELASRAIGLAQQKPSL
jgi:3-phenylpropionate/trans-cinnamate dioxygenase ferredoxin reductase subunit